MQTHTAVRGEKFERSANQKPGFRLEEMEKLRSAKTKEKAVLSLRLIVIVGRRGHDVDVDVDVAVTIGSLPIAGCCCVLSSSFHYPPAQDRLGASTLG
jgi:hypothetical protein